MEKLSNEEIINNEMLRIKQDFFESLKSYRQYIRKCEYDAPIEVLCLPKDILKPLLRHGCVRVFDIMDLDLTKIKGLGKIRIGIISSRLQQFFPM